MIDITRAEILRFGDGQTVTVYDDFEDANLKYVVPLPRFVHRDIEGTTQPVFTLFEYTIEGGDRRGTLTFSVELDVPQDAWEAVKAKYPDARFGQLRWEEADVYLTFRVRENEEPKVFLASPSLAGSNQASYVLALQSADELDFIKTNFGPGAPDVSQLQLSYDVTTLTKLRAVTATVEFNASRALDYEKTVDVKKNMWGSVTDRKVTIRQNLKASESGSTLIDYNIPDPSAEFRQRVENWAFGALEGLVQRAVDEAAERLGPGNADRMSATYLASFSRSYQENQVIEWMISPNAFLPAAAIRDNWGRHFQEVDFRKLAVTFTVLGALKDADIARVELDVNYGDVGETFVFKPDGETTITFETDGRKDDDGRFDPNYSYTYTVSYEDGKTFKTEAPIETAQTEVTVNLAELGFVKVIFDGTNLDWDELDQVAVGFFFQPPADRAPVNETKLLRQGQQNVIFSNKFLLRATDFAFNYQLAFRLKDGTLYRQSPILEAGASVRRLVLLQNPLQETPYTVAVNNVDQAPRIDRALLTGTYDDAINGFHEQKTLNFTTGGDDFVEKGVTVRAVVNPNASYLRLNGRLIMSGAPVLPINDIYISGQDTFLLLNSDQRPFTVKFDPFQVAWAEGVTRVQVDVFDALPINGSTALEEYERGLFSRSITFAPVQNADGAAELETPTPPQYFSFDFGIGAQPMYVYEITYFHADSGPSYSGELTASQGTVVLPKDGDSRTPVRHVVRENVDVECLARAA